MLFSICMLVGKFQGVSMCFINKDNLSLIRYLKLYLFIAFGLCSGSAEASQQIEFNADVLDAVDRKNIDLSRFNNAGYIMPGAYTMSIYINKRYLPEQVVEFYIDESEGSDSRACITNELVEKIGFKSSTQNKIQWWHNGQCLDEKTLNGFSVSSDLATSALYLNIPQAHLEYSDVNWDPPSLWDDGINGIIFDYNLNVRNQHQQREGRDLFSLNGNGLTGANLGPWRLRADWQAQYNHLSGGQQNSQNKIDWTRYYAYRAITSLKSKLMLGENFLDSNMFDSFRFTGASLTSDDNMLPPNLRGYAPEVVGIANTNAKITISQQGRVIYMTTVAAGPYRIQDINDAISGELNVKVEEQDGRVQEYTVNTSNIPYLTRPGSIRYKIATGFPSEFGHNVSKQGFGAGEFSWGVSNGWSMYGGALSSKDYNAISLGIGRDLMDFGALSFDATESRAKLPYQDTILTGGSYRASYSKSFDEYDSQITFAGYRFSERNFMSMSEYLNALHYSTRGMSGKEMYSITFNKHFRDFGLSSYVNYTHETYWDIPSNDRYNLTMSKFLDLGSFRNLSLSLSAYRNEYKGRTDNGGYLSVSMPWGKGATLGYNATVDRHDTVQKVNYYDSIDEFSNYQISTGYSRQGINSSGYYTRVGDLTRFSANASYQEGSYSAFGFSSQGGFTLTGEGGAAHRSAGGGGTRLLLDTQGVADVPVHGYGRTTNTNYWGKAVVGDVSSYHRNKVKIDLNKLSENTEAVSSVVEATLTEGSIGYRKFKVISGAKKMAAIRLKDGSHPPFGAVVNNSKSQDTGIIGDEGMVYLTGIKEHETMTVNWSGVAQCKITLPDTINLEKSDSLLLPCI